MHYCAEDPLINGESHFTASFGSSWFRNCTRGPLNCAFPGCRLYGKWFLCTVIGTYVRDIRDTCTQCNVVNSMHVGDVRDTCMYL